MKNLNIILIVGAVILLAGLIFVTSLTQKTSKEAKNPQVFEQGQQTNREEVVPTEEIPKVRIEISNFTFSPNTITVKPGEIITITNRDTVGHSLTSDSGLFDTGILSKNESSEVKAPIEPGEYGYHCTPHPNMKGKIIVRE